MRILDWLDGRTDGNGTVVLAATIAAIFLLVAVTVACFSKKSSVFVGVALLVVGGLEYAFFALDTVVRTAAFFRAALWLAVGVSFVIVKTVIALLRWIESRKRRLILSKKGDGRLPDSGNSFVRARLHTALSAGEDEMRERKSVPYENRGSVRLGYARRLLAGIQDAPLSPAERLETESLQKSFGQYASSEKWSGEDLRAVNELFARLLKLAAKYSVDEEINAR